MTKDHFHFKTRSSGCLLGMDGSGWDVSGTGWNCELWSTVRKSCSEAQASALVIQTRIPSCEGILFMTFLSSPQTWMSVHWAPTTVLRPRPATTSRAASAACSSSVLLTTFESLKCEYLHPSPGHRNLAQIPCCPGERPSGCGPCLNHLLLFTCPHC